jgi:hypothetical protein
MNILQITITKRPLKLHLPGWLRAGTVPAARFCPFWPAPDLNHLYNNSMPLLVLLAAFNFYAKQAFPSVRYFIFRYLDLVDRKV